MEKIKIKTDDNSNFEKNNIDKHSFNTWLSKIAIYLSKSTQKKLYFPSFQNEKEVIINVV